jgi:hypothetical protein
METSERPQPRLAGLGLKNEMFGAGAADRLIHDWSRTKNPRLPLYSSRSAKVVALGARGMSATYVCNNQLLGKAYGHATHTL